MLAYDVITLEGYFTIQKNALEKKSVALKLCHGPVSPFLTSYASP